MPFYRKKPVVIEAMKFNGYNGMEVADWVGANAIIGPNGEQLFIRTLEGVMQASAGDYVIKGVDGEFYPCKPWIFEQTYDAVDDDVVV